jgi:CBS domain-containing protein
MNIEDVMTRDVLTVQPDTPLKELATVLVERRISGLPVVLENGAVAGVVSEGDILFKERGPADQRSAHHWLTRHHSSPDQAKLAARTAGEIMTAPAITIGPRSPLAEAARLMLTHSVNRLPVVEDNRLVGIITRADMVRAFARSDEAIAHEIREDVIRHVVLLRDPGAVTVEVDRGKVTLTGLVDTRSDAELVRTLSAKVPGVIEVESSLAFHSALHHPEKPDPSGADQPVSGDRGPSLSRAQLRP